MGHLLLIPHGAQSCWYLIFSTKDRFPFLKEDIRDRTHAYLATILRDMGSPFVVVGGVADHVHILFDMGRIHAAKDFVEEVKRESSKSSETLNSHRRIQGCSPGTARTHQAGDTDRLAMRRYCPTVACLFPPK